ncbi:hypothetical protein Tco_0837831 [Tanacetum coccineum]
MVGLKENMKGVNLLTKAHGVGGGGGIKAGGKSIWDDAAAKVSQFECDMCVKEFLALKNCMHAMVLNA